VNELTSQTIASNGAASPPYEPWGAYNQASNMCQTLSNPFDGMYIVWSELGLS